MPAIPLKALDNLPPPRDRLTAARDYYARADALDGRIMQLECDGGMFCDEAKKREWRALKDERGRCLDNACTLANVPIERLHVVLFDECEAS